MFNDSFSFEGTSFSYTNGQSIDFGSRSGLGSAAAPGVGGPRSRVGPGSFRLPPIISSPIRLGVARVPATPEITGV